jgi:hypothetical protein
MKAGVRFGILTKVLLAEGVLSERSNRCLSVLLDRRRYSGCIISVPCYSTPAALIVLPKKERCLGY